MFGYVNAHKDLLRVCDYNIYRGYYCGLCKTLGKKFNPLTRFGLSYDMTFLAILLSALSKEHTTLKQEPCIAHPLSKRPVASADDAIRYSADMSVLLGYYKLKDDWDDEKSLKSLARVFYYFPMKKVAKQYPRQAESIRKNLAELRKLEQKNCNKPDQVAHCFGTLLEDIFDKDAASPALRLLGYHIGRLIYLTDAYTDMAADQKHNSYNPFLALYGKDVSKETVKEALLPTLTYTLSEIAAAYDVLPLKKHKELLDNIIYLGLRKTTDSL